ncbi:MAG: uracil-DNA glycosylase family protein [Rickettsiales bacterium]
MKEILTFYKDLGVDTVLEGAPVNRLAASSTPLALEEAPKELPAFENARYLADKATSLEELEKYVKGFTGCDLKKTAMNTVFGDGSASAEVMFIGEAPGANEDKEGIPFCGQSGKLLNNILKATGFARETVYITNTVFWRPPGNRRPTPDEIKICRPFVEKSIALIHPKMLVLVGSTAVESLLDSKVSMHTLRETNYMYENRYTKEEIPTFVIFHPSYLLRQPTKKKLMWFDFLKIKEAIA